MEPSNPAGASLPPAPALSPPRRWLLSLLPLAAGLAIYLFASPYYDLFPTNKNPGFALLLALLFLGSSFFLYRRPRLNHAWRLAYAFFTGAAAMWLLLVGIFGVPVSRSNVLRFDAADKVVQMLHIVPALILLSLLVKMRLGDLYLQRGELKGGLRFGLISFAGWSLIGGWIALDAGMSLAEMWSGLGWVLIFVFANAFMEELWFRGIYLRWMVPLVGRLPAAAATTLVFGISHMGATYINPGEALVFVAQVCFVGAVCAWSMLKYRSLWPAVLFHAGADLIIMLPIIASG